MKKMSRPVIRLLLRLPADIHSDLKAHAKKEERSLNSAIIRIIRTALATKK